MRLKVPRSAGNKAKLERSLMTKSGGVRVSSRTGSCRSHLERISRASAVSSSITLGGGPSLYLGQVKSVAAADLIVPGFMAALMVHLALTRGHAAPRRAFACVRATIRKYLVKNGLGRPLDWTIWLRVHGCIQRTNSRTIYCAPR